MREIVPPDLTPLIQALSNRDWDIGIQAQAALIAIGPAAVEPLTQALNSSDIHVRRIATETLGGIGWTANDSLEKALDDPDWGVRWYAKRALKQIREAEMQTPTQKTTNYSAGQEMSARIGVRFVPKVLQNMQPVIGELRVARLMAHIYWWQLTDKTPLFADNAYQGLDDLTARITEIEVAALNHKPFLLDSEGLHNGMPYALLVAISTIIAALLGLASNVVASYLQEHYHLITDMGRFSVTIVIFVLTMIATVLVTLLLQRRNG